MEEKTYLKLSDIMEGISKAVRDVFPLPQWVEAEIVSINVNKISGHCYLEVMETDSNGNEICKTKMSIWKSNVAKIFDKFKKATNSDLKAGVKVLFNCKISFHKQYMLSMAIEDINPEYTLGGMELKIKEILNKLELENLINKNKFINPPFDFSRVAVISPSDAAGLGDFKKDADILEKFSLCKFDYFPAIFQGKETGVSISNAIKSINQENYDALIIIRGGGAKTDLHFLNEYEIAKEICISKIPVLVGIGHERDKGVLDYVANISFDTPSKVIGFIFSVINENVNLINNNFKFISQNSKNIILKNKIELNDFFNNISQNSFRIINLFNNAVNTLKGVISYSASSVVKETQNKIKNNFDTSCLLAKNLINEYNKEIENLNKVIKSDGIKLIDIYKKDIFNLLQYIKSFSPDEILNFGFAIVKKEGELVTSTNSLKENDILEIFFKNSSIKVKIIGD